eukprot:m.220499 g.220499  ORF g.220499 m.220499 type:complete len:431 (-) comp10388_c0_seq1:296-1588(-)
MAEENIEGDELLAYDEEQEGDEGAAPVAAAKKEKGDYASVHSSTFKDFLLKDELLKAITDCGFEHPSEVQHECIPQAILGGDIVCQAKSGMGKTAVFVLSTLQLLDLNAAASADRKGPLVLVMAHTRELAFQINKEYERFSKYFPNFKCLVVYGGVPIKENITALEGKPHVLVGTPGRVLDLVRQNKLDLSSVKHFVLDECDSLLENLDMRADVQEIFKKTPHRKQVLMFSATLPGDVRAVCKKFMKSPVEIFVDDDTKLTLHGLKQFYVRLTEAEKNRKLVDLMDALEFNQLIIFVKSIERCKALNKILNEQKFPAIGIHSKMDQAERIAHYTEFKSFKKRILVATDLFGRGMDIERVNIAINYDMPDSSDSYLHRVARAGRFGTKGLAVSFVSSDEDAKVLNEVQSRFEVEIQTLPDSLDKNIYMESK